MAGTRTPTRAQQTPTWTRAGAGGQHTRRQAATTPTLANTATQTGQRRARMRRRAGGRQACLGMLSPPIPALSHFTRLLSPLAAHTMWGGDTPADTSAIGCSSSAIDRQVSRTHSARQAHRSPPTHVRVGLPARGEEGVIHEKYAEASASSPHRRDSSCNTQPVDPAGTRHAYARERLYPHPLFHSCRASR